MNVEQLIPSKKIAAIEAMPVWNRKFELKVHDDLTIDFLNSLSKGILTNQRIKHVAAFTALGFWLRKSSILSMLAENQTSQNKKIRLSPLGIVFHVCPSNVDTMFVYSLAISLLMGNKNILRISKRAEHPTMDVLFCIFNDLLATDKFKLLQEYITVVTYGHEAEINSFISGKVDGRVLWGGDKTINTFKNVASQPRTKDIVFADRLSYAVINATTFNSLDEPAKNDLVKKFFNDSYTFDQKGCSSPQLMMLIGNQEDKRKFKETFYTKLSSLATDQYDNDDYSLSSLKLNAAVLDIAEHKIDAVTRRASNLYFAELNPDQISLSHSCGGGYFYIYNMESIYDVLKLVDKKVQTISYFGLSQEDKETLAEASNGIGIDRIVPIGFALSFDNLWDGYNLMDELSMKKVLL